MDAPAAAPPEAAPPAAAPAGPDAVKLHKLALDAQGSAEQLATGLAQVHADPAAVQAVGDCAKVFRKILTGLAKAAQAEQPPAPAAGPETMHSATDALQAALAAKRQGGSPQ